MPKRKNTDPGVYRYPVADGTKWGAVYYVDRDWESGRPRQKRKQGFATKAEAQAWRVEQLAGRNKTGRVVEPSKMALASYLDEWLASLADIAPSTRRNYRNRLTPFKQAMGSSPLWQVTPLMLDQFNASRQRRGDSITEIRTGFRIFKQALRKAVHVGLLPSNPCDPIKPPRAVEHQATIWTIEEMHRFRVVNGDDPEWGLVWHTLIETWLRISEFVDLRWADIDMATRTITISHALSRNEAMEWESGPTKTPSSRRAIPISDGLTRRLRALQVESGRRGDQFVFCQPETDEHLEQWRVARALTKACERAGVPTLTPHELRHTGGSLAFMDGASELAVSKRLGHSDTKITRQVYLRLNDAHHRAVADRIAALFEPKSDADMTDGVAHSPKQA
jgi:integrase